MRKTIHVLLLAVYLLVGYAVPLANRSPIAYDREAYRAKKGKNVPKSMRVRSLWKMVKHVPSSQETPGLELTGVISPESIRVYGHEHFLHDPIVQLIAFSHSPFNSHLRAPPVA